MRRRTTLIALLTLAARAALAADDLPAYKNLALPFEARAADMVKRMDLADKANQVQMASPPIDRLGIPACNWWSEALHGVGRAGTATIYPQAIGLAATWNPDLIRDVASAIADEARAKYDPYGTRYRGLMLWCPTINLARDPRWGRVEETYGEDPFLTSRIAVGYVQGLQGNDSKYLKTVATPKHFAVHSQEVGRMNRNITISEALMRDYYFPAFQACFTEGKAASVMSAHNALDGIPCTANHWLLTDVLRDQWGFQGAVVSDWNAVAQLALTHRYVNTEIEAVTAALNAGVDVICDPRPLAGAVVQAVDSGKLSEATLDKALTRNLLLRFRLGLFDPPDAVPFARTSPTAVGSPEHIALARESARQATVMIKNDAAPKGRGFEKLLPLDLRRIDSIAVLGPYANVRQFGAYSAQAPAGPCPTILDALRTAAGDRVQIKTAEWTDTPTAIAAASSSTLSIIVLGLSISIEKEGIDRQSLDLPLDQRLFLEKMLVANPLAIVVIEGGSPIGLEAMKEKVPALLNIWYPGEQGANALTDILFGKANPAGRLPMTYYRSVNDLPPMDDYDITHGRTYMYLKTPVTYPFGHGLSYTTFEYKPLRAPARATPTDTIEITCDIANTGPLDGDEVAQLYVRQLNLPADSPRPQQQLKAFQRLPVQKNKSATLRLKLPIASLGHWNTKEQKYVVDPGQYELMLGSSSADIRQRATITIQNP